MKCGYYNIRILSNGAIIGECFGEKEIEKCLYDGHCEKCSKEFAGPDLKEVEAEYHQYKYPIYGSAISNGKSNIDDRPINIRIHGELCDSLKDIYIRKNHDYGDSFHKTYLEEGMAMPRIRLTDKLERFKKLTKSDEQLVNDESVRDTLLDLANYAIMTVVEMDRAKET